MLPLRVVQLQDEDRVARVVRDVASAGNLPEAIAVGRIVAVRPAVEQSGRRERADEDLGLGVDVDDRDLARLHVTPGIGGR